MPVTELALSALDKPHTLILASCPGWEEAVCLWTEIGSSSHTLTRKENISREKGEVSWDSLYARLVHTGKVLTESGSSVYSWGDSKEPAGSGGQWFYCHFPVLQSGQV